MEQYILSLDQGTTSSRCILFNRKGEVVSQAQKEFNQHYPQPGWVEHDPMEIWSTQLGVARESMARVGATHGNIAAIGITNQRETTIVWDRKTGKPVYPAIVWQCRRTADRCNQLREKGFTEFFRSRTGLLVDAYFSATKLSWILDQVPEARSRAEKGDLLFGTVDSWLIWNLTGGAVHATDVTNASRTMLFNLNTMDWDGEILAELDIPKTMLPEVKPSSCAFGMTDPSLFGGSLPISGVAGDQQAALFGQTCFTSGEAKNTYGTGCFLLMHTGDTPVFTDSGLLTTVAASVGETRAYALEGSVFIGGAVIQWLRDELKLIHSAQETEELARQVPDTAGVYLVPAFVGLGAPNWDPYARGVITGLTRGAGRSHLVRAALESIAYQTYDVLKLMEEASGIRLSALKVDGGASANQFLMQFQADLIQTRVERPRCIETTALGAAYLAGLAVGYWKDTEDVKANWQVDRSFFPEWEPDKVKSVLIGWHESVRRSLDWTRQVEERKGR